LEMRWVRNDNEYGRYRDDEGMQNTDYCNEYSGTIGRQ
jgi:hypothetical protein